MQYMSNLLLSIIFLKFIIWNISLTQHRHFELLMVMTVVLKFYEE